MNNDDGLRRYMPSGGRLLLLLRAALTYSGDGGPFLVIRQSGAVYRHDVQVTRPEPSLASMCTLTGDDALAYASAKGWTSVLEPTADQLRDLMRQAVTLRDVPMWADNFMTYADLLASRSGQDRERMIERSHRAVAQRARTEFVR